jgi:hypothetical protein
MSKIIIWCASLALAGAVVWCGLPAAAQTAGSQGGATGAWGRAIEVPGLAALNTGGDAAVSSVSCASSGNCAAGGFYTFHGAKQSAFVADERNGRWGKAIEVPGLAALNTGEWAGIDQVSCASAGNCAVAGYYTGARGQQGFVADERNGTWGTAIEVPGLGALNKAGNAEVYALSCAGAGNCVAGGFYSSSQLGERGFVAVEQNGTWGTAIEVPGLAALDKDTYSSVSDVSCASAGNCAVGGDYTFHGGDQGAFVASDKKGVWSNATAVPGLAALNAGQVAGISSVSCASAGNCTASGDYSGRRGSQGFVTAERNDRWGTALQVPAPGGALIRHGDSGVFSLSCSSAGNCTTGGYFAYLATPKHSHGFVADERNGRWGTAMLVPGLSALDKARNAQVQVVSCASAGNCAAGGFYFDRPRHYEWFVALERNGRWGTAIPVPGFETLNKRSDGVDIAGYFSLSCAPAGTCAAGGYYIDASGADQGFVTQSG